MARKRKGSGKKTQVAMPVMRPDAAGIDIGATEIYVAVPAAAAMCAVCLAAANAAWNIQVTRTGLAHEHLRRAAVLGKSAAGNRERVGHDGPRIYERTLGPPSPQCPPPPPVKP